MSSTASSKLPNKRIPVHAIHLFSCWTLAAAAQGVVTRFWRNDPDATTFHMNRTSEIAAHSDADVLTRLDGDVADPEWVQQTHFGLPLWACGQHWHPGDAGPCSSYEEGGFLNSDVLTQEKLKVADVAYSAMYLGRDTCELVDGLNESNPFRLIVDSTYANWPSCCMHMEFVGSLLSDARSPVAEHAQESWVDFQDAFLAWPAKGTCTEVTPCSVVVAISGAGNNPWFLYQTGCPACFDSLRSVLIAPKVCPNVTCLDATVMPRLRHLLKRYSNVVDADKVYLVSTSRGNEVGFSAAIRYPNVFKIVAMAGEFDWDMAGLGNLTDDSMQDLLHRATKLESIQFHVGDKDGCKGNRWWPTLDTFAALFPRNLRSSGSLHVEVRIYLEAQHPIWYAVWNVLHSVIWTGGDLNASAVLGTCAWS